MSKSRFLLSLLTLAAIGLTGVATHPAFSADKGWTVSFEEAKKLAAEQGKDIFMEFTGSDWCPPCKALHKNVLSQEVFLSEVPKDFILLKLDNPRDKSNQSEEEQAQYKRLAAQFKVSGVPSVFLADAEGKPYVKMVGYGGTAADGYVNQIGWFAEAQTAEGVEKAKLLDQAISVTGNISKFGEQVDQILALDADNKAGLKEKYEDLKKNAEKLAALQTQLNEIMADAAKDSEAALKKIDDLIDAEMLKGQLLQQAMFAKGAVLFRTDKDASKKVLEAAAKLDEESQLGKRIEAILKARFN